MASAAAGSYLLAIDILGGFFEGAKIREKGRMAFMESEWVERKRIFRSMMLFHKQHEGLLVGSLGSGEAGQHYLFLAKPRKAQRRFGFAVFPKAAGRRSERVQLL